MLVFKKEQEAAKAVRAHLALTDKALRRARHALEAYLAGDRGLCRELAAKVDRLESDADERKRDVRNRLFSGAFLPQIRSDIFELVAAIDAIAGKAESASRMLSEEEPMIPERWATPVNELFARSTDCFAELKEAMRVFLGKKGDFDTLHEHVNRVTEIEGDVDDREEALTREVFASDLALAEKLHIQRLLERIGAISDRTEDAADVLETAALKAVV